MHPVATILHDAAELNRADPRRKGNLVSVESAGTITISGDIHGNRMNLHKILEYALKGISGDPLVVLQEIIHGPPDEKTGFDRSIEVLVRASRMKLNKPGNIVFVMGNHDLAQFTGKEIAKEDRGSCEEFRKGVEHTFGENSSSILEAIDDFCRSLPLGVRCANGIVACHSLPSGAASSEDDTAVFHRHCVPEDYQRGGGVYDWTWGKKQNPERIAELAKKLGASFFVVGHRHIYDGWQSLSDIAVTIDSSGPLGCIFECNGREPVDPENVKQHVRRISKL